MIPSPLRRVSLFAAVLALCAGALGAQERVKIDLEKHFPGLLEAFDSDYNALYEFADFMGVEGRMVDEATLAEWQAKWTAERARAEAELDKLKADPQRHMDFTLRKRLERHHYFRDRFRDEEFRADFSYPPFVLYVQAGKDGDPGTSPEDVERYGTWFQRLERAFRAEFAEPLGLKMGSTLPGYSIFLLRGRDEYKLYASELGSDGLYWARAHYDPSYRIGVTYQDKGGAAQDSDEIHSAMHEMVHAFQHAYHKNAGEETKTGLSTPSWFNEGFAEFLAYRVRMVEKGERETVPRGPAGELTSIVKKYGDAGARCVLPLVQLTQITNYNQAASIFSETLAKGGHAVGDPMQTLGLMYRQSDLWMHFLYDGNDGARRELMLCYVQAVLNDASEREAYARSFAAVEPGVLDAEYVDFLAAHKVERDAVEKLRATRPDPATLPKIPPTPDAGVLVRADAGATDDPSGDGDTAWNLGPDLRLSGALELARTGRWSASAAALRELASAGDLGDLASLVERSAARADALVAFRADFLRHAADSGSRIALRVDGKRLLARVRSVEADAVVLDDNPLDVERLTLDEIDALSLCDAARGGRSGFEAPAIASYPYLLEGQPGWELKLDDSAESSALRDDADELRRLATDAGAAGGLLALAALGEPSSSAEGERVLALVRDLMANSGEDPRVRARRGAVRAAAASAARATFVASDPGDGLAELKGALGTGDDGAARLFYAFDDAAELDDFDVDVTSGDGAKVDGSSLVLIGEVAAAARVGLDAPFRVRLKLRVPVDPDPANDPRVAVRLTGGGAEAVSGSWGELSLTDADDSRALTGDEWPRNRLFELEVVHDGSKLSTRIEGLTTAQIDAGGLNGASVELSVKSPRPVYVAELELSGTIGAGDQERAREAHVARTLAQLGL